jgi:hypothetical protein
MQKNMNSIRIHLLFSALSLLLTQSFSLSAQEGWEAGGWAGVSYYFGDLNTSFDVSEPGFAAGAAARYNFNKRVCFKFSANYGNISGDDSDSKVAFERARNLNFQSAILDAGAQLEFNFLPYTHGSKDEFWTPYLLAGFSIFSYNPKTEYQGELLELRDFGTEGQFKGEEYSTTSGAFLFGGGIKIDLSYEWSINLEISGRRAFTDYLDDVSTVYPDMEDLENLRGGTAVALSDRSLPNGSDGIRIGETGRQRGNSRDNDNYLFFGIGLMYYFGDLKCPTYSR